MKSIRIDGGAAASRTCALACLVLVLAPVLATGGETEDLGSPIGADGVITKANLGPSEVWPLKIERGTFVCKGKAVFISDGVTAYPLNGLAQALTRRYPKNRKPLEDVWLVDREGPGRCEGRGPQGQDGPRGHQSRVEQGGEVVSQPRLKFPAVRRATPPALSDLRRNRGAISSRPAG